MKKVRKILLNALVGFPVGITLLILTYVSIYFIAGEHIFNYELNQLHNIQTLISQIVSAGLSGYVLFISFYIASFLQNKETEKNLMTKHPHKSVILLAISSIGLVIINVLLLGNTQIFGKNIITMNLVTLFIIYTLAAIIFGIKNVIEKQWIKEINQKLKTRNKDI